MDVGTHGHAGLGYQLDTVLGHSRYWRSVDNLGIYGHLHGLKHVAARQVNGGSLLEVEGDVGLVGADEGVYNPADVALGQIVGLKFVGVEFKAGLGAGNHSLDNGSRRDLAPAHQNKLDQ